MNLFYCRCLIFCLVLCGISTRQMLAQKLSEPAKAKLVRIVNEGLTKQNKGDYTGAMTNFNEALSISPNDIQILLFRAQLNLIIFNKPRATIEDASKVITLDAKKVEAYTMRGLAYLNDTQILNAQKDLEQALSFNRPTVDMYRGLCVTYSVQQKFDKAIEITTKGLKLFPNNPTLHYERANNYANLQRCREAIEDYNVVTRFAPDNENAYLNRANCRAMLKDIKGAIEDYGFLIKKNPNEIKYWANRGNAFRDIQMYDSAITHLKTAIRLDPQDFRPRIWLANTYFAQGDNQAVIRECTNILRDNPQDLFGFANGGNMVNAYLQREAFLNNEVYAMRAIAYMKTGNIADARVDRERAIYLQALSTMIPDAFESKFAPADNFPKKFQFYPRNNRDSATLQLAGTVLVSGYDSVYAVLLKNNVPVRRIAAPLQYQKAVPPFTQIATEQAIVSISMPIHAEMSLYTIVLGVRDAKRDSLLVQRDSIVCGDAFLVSGQSNVVLGEQVVEPPVKPFLRTFTMNSGNRFWGIATAKTGDDFNVGGAAFSMMSRLATEQRIPIAVINGGLSGSTIEQHFRDNAAPTQPRSWYGRMLWRAQQSGLASAAKAMVWYQGESNASADYTQKFATLYDSWKLDYPALSKVYVVQVRPSECGQSPIDSPHEPQRSFGDRFPKAEVFAAAALPNHDGCHYGNIGYLALGERLASLIRRDVYASADSIGISSPNVKKVGWSNATRDEFIITFATNDSLVCGADTSVGGQVRTLATDAFLLDGKPVKAASVRSQKNQVIVKLAASSNASMLSYIPEKCYPRSPEAPCTVYEGPWITTRRGVGALTFTNVLIQSTP